MGIVAFCPSGHRIKVKDHLAGRKGICPTCGSRFRIPWAAAATLPAGSFPPAAGIPLAAVVSLDGELAATLPRAIALSAAASVRPESDPAADIDQPSDAEVVVDADPQIPVPGVIAEAMAAAWCTAVPGGDASPPMPAAALLDWLTSGRVTGRELVWRSDWSEWRPVGEVFPEHAPSQRPPSAR